MSRQAEADLILKLYELRREETMRKARAWYAGEFNPDSFADFQAAITGEHSGHLRMVLTYWDMAASLVVHNAISLELFNDANVEHFTVFSKVELMLPEIRGFLFPQFLQNLEKVIEATHDGRERIAAARERRARFRAAALAAKELAATP